MESLNQTDWLGTLPCFYHERTGAFSHCVHDVIDYRNLEIDPAGLKDYLDFGYCVFGHTPVRHVRFLPPCTALVRDATGTLRESSLPDPVDEWHGRRSTPTEALESLRAALAKWQAAQRSEIVLPLSGGHDSRLLAMLLPDRTQARAFTYGVSRHQESSREVTRARYVADRLNIKWQRIELGDFHSRMDDWDATFGVSTHAHGMYHFEFYDKIAAVMGGGRPILSGLCGDPWAGHIPRLPAASANDLPALGLSRGVTAAHAACRLQSDGRYREAFWTARRERFRDPEFQIVEVFRMKMMLLNFAERVPAQLGFTPYSPYVEPEIALKMLTLPPEQRYRRRWQHEYFAAAGLDVTGSHGGSSENNLDLHALRKLPPPHLDVSLLRELFAERYLHEINQRVFTPSALSRAWSLALGHTAGAKLAHICRLPNQHSAAYAAYVTLKPLENLLRRRNQA